MEDIYTFVSVASNKHAIGRRTTDGRIITQIVINGKSLMPIVDLDLPMFITFSAYPILCTVHNIPTGQTLVSGIFVLKTNQDNPDNQAIFTKNITTASIIGQGQITDSGGDSIGEALFDITATDTGLIETFPVSGN